MVLENSENKKRKILISGHRGYHAKETDNTAKAFQRAIDEGLNYIEFDVRRSKDGVPIVFHDTMLDKLTTGTGPIENKTLSELRQIKYKDGQSFQTLREMLEQCAHKIGLILEVKSDGLEEQIVELIKEFKIEDSIIVQSFKREHVVRIHELYPHPKIKWAFCIGIIGMYGILGHWLHLDDVIARKTFEKYLKPHKFIHYFNIDGPIVSHRFVEEAISNGIRMILGAMKTHRYLNKLDAWKVDIINCNDPKDIMKRIGEQFPNQFCVLNDNI